MHDATKRFEIEILLKAGLPKGRVAGIAGVSLRTVHRVRAEVEARSAQAAASAETTLQAAASPSKGGLGRPSKVAAYRDLVASILEAEPALKTLEVLRRVRRAGYGGGKSALYELVRELRPCAVRPVARFEGVAGEFSQHDCGEVRLRWDGTGPPERVQFFCSRLQFSRYALVKLVADQRTETLVRSLAEHFQHWGGIPLLAVFDRASSAALKSDPKTGEVLEWNPVFADVTQRMGLGVDLCWPGRPNQKGAIENLVGWVKGSFFKVRRFRDRADLEAQLADWLRDGNERRPSRATRRIPAELLAEERRRLRPLRLRPAELALRLPVSVGPTAMVEHATNKYSMPPETCGFPGTLHLFADRVRIVAGRHRADHPRLPAGSRGVSNLPAHRTAMLEAVSGRRGRQYSMREHLFQLGPAAQEVITEIIYADRHSWNDKIERLHELLQAHGDEALRAAFERQRGRVGCRVADIARDLALEQIPLPFAARHAGGSP